MMVDEGHRIIDDDFACINCGYNIRGLSEGSRCPECNSPVNISINNILLEFANLKWLDYLLYGFRIKLGLMVIVFIGLIILAVFPRTFMFMAVGLIVKSMWIIGSLLITTQEPRISSKENRFSLRRIVRFSAIFGIATVVYNLNLHLYVPNKLTDVLSRVFVIVGALALLAELYYYNFFCITYSR